MQSNTIGWSIKNKTGDGTALVKNVDDAPVPPETTSYVEGDRKVTRAGTFIYRVDIILALGIKLWRRDTRPFIDVAPNRPTFSRISTCGEEWIMELLMEVRDARLVYGQGTCVLHSSQNPLPQAPHCENIFLSFLNEDATV